MEVNTFYVVEVSKKRSSLLGRLHNDPTHLLIGAEHLMAGDTVAYVLKVLEDGRYTFGKADGSRPSKSTSVECDYLDLVFEPFGNVDPASLTENSQGISYSIRIKEKVEAV